MLQSLLGLDLFSGKQPNDPYTSYLLCPRLTFNGTFMADVSTINNNPSNYDTANVIQPILSWNPQGTGEWKVNAVVTRVCYANTTCVVDSKGALEPMVGANFQGMHMREHCTLYRFAIQLQDPDCN